MKRIILFISIISVVFSCYCELFASTQQMRSNKHKEHEIKSGTPLPIYYVKTPGLLTIYFEAAIGEVNLTIADKNNEIIYIKQLYIGEPMSLAIKLDKSIKEYNVFINKL